MSTPEEPSATDRRVARFVAEYSDLAARHGMAVVQMQNPSGQYHPFVVAVTDIAFIDQQVLELSTQGYVRLHGRNIAMEKRV